MKLCQADVEEGQPILEGLQGEAAENQADAEGAQPALWNEGLRL